MRLRETIVLGLVTGLILSISAVAYAADGETTITGRGWLYARGTGEVSLDMKGTLRMQVDGDVSINDLAGDMTFEIESGNAALAVGPEIELEDFHGTIIVRGSHYVVEAEGSMRFLAHGAGVAHLEGNGIWKTRHGGVHRWSSGERIELVAA